MYDYDILALNGPENNCDLLRGAIKKNTVFFLLSVKRGGGSRPIQKVFIRFFGIICQKKMGVLYKKTGSFFTIIRRKGGGSRPSQKILIRKN